MVRDFVGQVISAGKKVAYACRKGSALWLQLLTVSMVDETGREPVIKGYNDRGRQVSLKNLQNVIVVPDASV